MAAMCGGGINHSKYYSEIIFMMLVVKKRCAWLCGVMMCCIGAVILASCDGLPVGDGMVTGDAGDNSSLNAVHDDRYSLALKHTDQGYEFVACLGSLVTLNTASCVSALTLPDGESLDYRFVANEDLSLKDLEEIDRLKQELAKEYFKEKGDLPADFSLMTGGGIVGGALSGAAGVSAVKSLLAKNELLDAKLLLSSLHQQKKLSSAELSSLLAELKNHPATLETLKMQASQRWAFMKRTVLATALKNPARTKNYPHAAILKQVNHFYNSYVYKQAAELGGHLQAEVAEVANRLKLLSGKESGGGVLPVPVKAEPATTASKTEPVATKAHQQQAGKVQPEAVDASPVDTDQVGAVGAKNSVRYQIAAKQARQAKEYFRKGDYRQGQLVRQSMQDHWLLDDVDKVEFDRDVFPYLSNHKVLIQRFESLHKRGVTMLSEGKDMTQFLAGSIEDVHMELMNQADIDGPYSFANREKVLEGLKKEAVHRGLYKSSGSAPVVVKAVSNQASKQTSMQTSIQKNHRGIALSKNNKVISANPASIGGRVMRFVGWTVTLVGGLAVIVAVVNHAGSKTLTDLKSLYPWGGGDSSQAEDGSEVAGLGEDKMIELKEETSQEILGDMAAGVPFVPVSLYGTYYPYLVSDHTEVSLEVPSVVSVLKTLAIHASYGNVDVAKQVQICLPMSATVAVSNCQPLGSF